MSGSESESESETEKSPQPPLDANRIRSDIDTRTSEGDVRSSDTTGKMVSLKDVRSSAQRGNKGNKVASAPTSMAKKVVVAPNPSSIPPPPGTQAVSPKGMGSPRIEGSALGVPNFHQASAPQFLGRSVSANRAAPLAPPPACGSTAIAAASFTVSLPNGTAIAVAKGEQITDAGLLMLIHTQRCPLEPVDE